MLLQICCLSVLLSASVLAHDLHRHRHPLPASNPRWRCPCPRSLCFPVAAEYRTQSFGFLDLSRRPDSSTWIALPSLTALVLSHETLEEPAVLASINSSFADLLCRTRAHGVRMLYRLTVEEPVSLTLHRFIAVFGLLPFDGVSLRLDGVLLDAPERAENATRRAIAMVRRMRPGAWVMVEQPSLRCTRCVWMHRLPRRLANFIYLPAYSDSDCPSAGFKTTAEVRQALATERLAAPARLVLGVALFALRFDCKSGAVDGCVPSAVCPERVAPRDLMEAGGLRRFGPVLQRTEVNRRGGLLQQLRLVRAHRLAGFGLFRANDLTANSSATFWRRIATYKHVVLDESGHDEMAVFFLILVGLLIMI